MAYLKGGCIDSCWKCFPLKMYLCREIFHPQQWKIIILISIPKCHATEKLKLVFLCCSWYIIYSAMIELYLFFCRGRLGKGHDIVVLLPFKV